MVHGSRNSIYIVRIQGTTLVVVTRNNVQREIIEAEIESATHLLQRGKACAKNMWDTLPYASGSVLVFIVSSGLDSYPDR